MVPEHKNPSKPERTALAPYNFIPVTPVVVALPENDPRNFLLVDQHIYHEEALTGWIDVTLTTQSPLYIRGVLTPAEHQRKETQEADTNDRTPHLDKLRNKPDFFHTGNPNSPVIPGSSLRGMIRQAVEIVTHGKLNPVSNVPLVYRSISDSQYRNILMEDDSTGNERNHFIPKVKGGYVRQVAGGWAIQPAQEFDGTTHARVSHSLFNNVRHSATRLEGYKAAYEVYIQTNEYSYKNIRGGLIRIKRAQVTDIQVTPKEGFRKAYVLQSGPMNSKKSESVIYAPQDTLDKPWIEIPEELVTAYLDQVTTGQLGQADILGSEEGVLRDRHPVFYLQDKAGQLLFFGHTQLFRIPYRRSPQQLLNPRHTDETRIDFAEAMFGRVKKNEGGRAGRIFVGDAQMDSLAQDKSPWLTDKPLIAKVLSSPKATTFQHYLTQNKPDVERGQALFNYNDSPQDTTLRGHKLYWHKGKVGRADIEDPTVDRKLDKIHTQFKPLRDGLTFRFRIHFENLLPAELGALWWAIKPQTEGTYCHKLGMGKPLGMGAVQLEPTLHLVNPKNRYMALFSRQAEGVAWHESPHPLDGKLQDGIAQFEGYILAAVYKNKFSQFATIPRIRHWLAMLGWPGPDKTKTRYLEIERKEPTHLPAETTQRQRTKGSTNEYKTRPVLPEPMEVSK